MLNISIIRSAKRKKPGKKPGIVDQVNRSAYQGLDWDMLAPAQ
jgi:hypothetical protein